MTTVTAATAIAIHTRKTRGIAIKACISHRITSPAQMISVKEYNETFQNLWKFTKFADHVL